MSDCIKCIHYPICSDFRKLMFKGHAEVCGEYFEVEAHDEQTRADERENVLDELKNKIDDEYYDAGYGDYHEVEMIVRMIQELKEQMKGENENV